MDDVEAALPAKNDVGFHQLPPDDNNTGLVKPLSRSIWTSANLDACARVSYPACFAIFNVGYWIFYLKIRG